jgi:5-dehydro-2-deoxygluconokinase
LSTETTYAAILKTVNAARDAGTNVVFDIDYRPVLWGLTEPGMGEDRFVASKAVSNVLHEVLPLADVIVGTMEEVRIAGGTEDTIDALRAIRNVSNAAIVLKLGADGYTVLEREIPATLDEATIYPGFPVEVFNVLGAGDAFMAGLLRGYLRGENWEQSCKLTNASGALVVSRHGCAPAIPSLTEIRQFIAEGSSHFRLREDSALEQLHWSATRYDAEREVLAFAFDHRT